MPTTTVDFTGSNGAAWPSPFIQKASSTGSSASIQSNRGRIVLPNLGAYGAMHAMGFSPDSDNYTITVDLIVLHTTGEQFQRLMWRNIADGSDGRCYMFEWGIDAANASYLALEIQHSDYSRTNLYSTSYTVAVNDVIHLKIQQQGTTLRAKHWKNAESEPGTYADYNAVPGTSYASGTVWLMAQGGDAVPGSTRNKEFDNFVIDTGVTITLVTQSETVSAIALTPQAGTPAPQSITLSPRTLTVSPVALTPSVLAPPGGPQSFALSANVVQMVTVPLTVETVSLGEPPPTIESPDPIVHTNPVPPEHLRELIFGPAITRRRRVDIYLADAETLWYPDVPVISGEVSVDNSRAERRMADFVFDNSDRTLDHSPDQFWYDLIIKVYHGIETPTEIWETQIGEFMIDRIREPHWPHEVSVSCRDYAKKLLLDKFAAAVAFAKGQRVQEVIQTIAINSGGDPSRPGIRKFNLNDEGAVLGIDVVFERKITRWEAIQKIADAYSLEVFFDRFGALTLRPYHDPVAAPLAFTFLTGDAGNLATYDKETNDTNLKNHVVVTGAATGNRIPVFAEAENTNPASATSSFRIGRRTFEEESALVTTTLQAKARAEQLLAVMALESYDISLGAVVAPWLEVGDAIEFLDPRASAGQPSRYMLSKLSIPLYLGTMSATGKRLTIVASTGAERKPPGYGTTNPPQVPPQIPGQTAPVVQLQPVSQQVASGATFSFSTQATGNPEPEVKWQYSTESADGPWNDISGATTTTLTEPATPAKNGNFYRAVFTNSLGVATTNAAQLTVQQVTTVPTAVGKVRLAWYWLDYNNPPSDTIINTWAPQISVAVLHPRMTATRDKIKARNSSCRVLEAKSVWTVRSDETTAPFSSIIGYTQAQNNGWIAQDNTP